MGWIPRKTGIQVGLQKEISVPHPALIIAVHPAVCEVAGNPGDIDITRPRIAM